MKRNVRTWSIAVCLAVVSVLSLPAQEVPLTEVTLFTSGVGELVHRGVPGANGRIVLPVARDQMDDLVRSLTVLGSGGAQVTDITFPAGETTAQSLARFRIDLNRVSDLVGLASEARGAAVEIATTRGQRLSGRVIGAVAGDTSGGSAGAQLLLATDGAVRTISGSAIESLAFTDPQVEREFLAAIAVLAGEGGPQAPQEVTIALAGAAGQPVTVRYLLEMPLWKTSYRAVLDGDRMLLQGWAHIHNTGTTDWQNIRLSIVSARPVTYGVDLYHPEYVSRSRPEPAPQVARTARPRAESEAMRSASGLDFADMLGSAVAVTAAEETLVAGIAFTFPDPVSIPRGESAMIPIVNREFEGELVRSFDSRRDRGNPRIAVSFRNTGGSQLPDGIVTVYDGDRYAGDSLLPVLFPGGEATLPYAVDIAHEVERESEADAEELRSVTIVNGLLVEEFRSRRTIRYSIGRTSEAGRPDPIRITHEVASGWDLVSPRATESSGREHVFVTSGTRLSVVEERIRHQRVALTSADREQLLSYSGNRLIDPTVRRALQNVVELRRQLEDARTARQALDGQLAAIRQEQERIRGNMEVLERDSTLYRRYVRTLDGQEDQLSLLQEDLADARQAEESASAALSEYLRTLQQ